MTPIDQNFSAPPDSPEETKPVAVFIVIGALALFFILECVLSLMPLKGLLEPDNVTLVAMGALDKYYLPQGQYYRLFTAALLHADLMHLGLNCLALAFSGMLLESLVGRSRFLVTWFLGALGGSALSVAWHKENFVGVGASGAGMAVLAAVLLAAMRLP